jgi:nitrate/TMAO reductase-like tetraheme cytochrome c subunit
MKNKPYIIAFLIICVFIAACSHKLYAPVEADAAWANTKWENIDLAALYRGKKYYSKNCGKCHSLKNPAKYSEKEWRQIMPKMAKKAKINDTTANIILAYVLTTAHGIRAQK